MSGEGIDAESEDMDLSGFSRRSEASLSVDCGSTTEYGLLMQQSLPITVPHLRIVPSGPSRSNKQYYHARYRNADENIFFQIQNIPIPDQAFDEPQSYCKTDLYPLYRQLRAPNAEIIQDFESPYVHFFLQRLPLNMGFAQLFPSVFSTIFAHSMTNKGLRSMMLAVSSFLADNMAERPPLRSYRYLQMGIPLIQQALTDGPIDDALIYSAFLAAYLHLIGGELASTRRHLEGLRLLLQRYSTVPGEFSPDMPTEFKFIYRMAIRMDHQWALGDHEAIFPLVPIQDGPRRQWIQRLVDYSQPEMVEWAVAQFALDDLLTKAIAINKRAIQLRENPGLDPDLAETAIRGETAKLLEERQAWNERTCVEAARKQQEAEQRMIELTDELLHTEQHRFLHYPPLKFSNKLYGAILVQYHWVKIYITFITHPHPGPYPYERFQAALDVCGTYANVRWPHACGTCQVVMGLYLTGLTLGEPMYPTEFNWIAERLKEIDKLCGFRAGTPVLNILRTTWRSEGSHWSHYKAGHNR